MNSTQKTEAQIYGDLTIQIYKATEKYNSDPEIEKLWQALRVCDAARRAKLTRGRL